MTSHTIRLAQPSDAAAVCRLNRECMGKNILGIAVDPAFRHQGIGRALLNAVEEWGKQSGACAVRLVSGMERTGAHLFYQHCGYLRSKEQLNMKKSLS